MPNFFIKAIKTLTRYFLDTEQGKFTEVPDVVIGLSLFMAVSAVIQAIADFILESLSLFEMIPKIPFRLEFLFLTIISAMLGIFTLEGLSRKEIDVTRNSLILSLVVEMFLVISDIWFLMQHSGNTTLWPEVVRIPFLIFTSINVLIVTYISFKMYILNHQKFPFRF